LSQGEIEVRCVLEPDDEVMAGDGDGGVLPRLCEE